MYLMLTITIYNDTLSHIFSFYQCFLTAFVRNSCKHYNVNEEIHCYLKSNKYYNNDLLFFVIYLFPLVILIDKFKFL